MHLADINISRQAVSVMMCAERKIPKPVTSLFLLQKLLFFFFWMGPLYRDDSMTEHSLHCSAPDSGLYSTNRAMVS